MDFRDKNIPLNDIVLGVIDVKRFNDWLHDDAEDNSNIVYRLKINLRYALQHELTEVQRTYLLFFFVNNLTIGQIAYKTGKKSTISRTIAAARKKLLHVLQYTDPTLLGTDFLSRTKF